MALRVAGPHHLWDGPDERTLALLTCPERRLGELAVCDIPCDRRCAHDPVLRVFDGRHGERDRYRRTILAQARGFDRVRGFTSRGPHEHCLLLLLPVDWHELIDGLPDDLFRRIAEYPLGTGVPTGDDSVQGLAEDGIARGIHDRGKSRLRFQALPVLGDIAKHSDKALRASRGIEKEPSIRRNPPDRPIQSQDPVFTLVERTVSACALVSLTDTLSIIRMHTGAPGFRRYWLGLRRAPEDMKGLRVPDCLAGMHVFVPRPDRRRFEQ